MTSDLPHPVAPALGDEPPTGFAAVEHAGGDEEYWHYAIWLPDGAVVLEEGGAPSEAQRSATLSRHARQSPESEIEIVGHFMRYEVEAADWLDAELDRLGHRVASRRSGAAAPGVGDLLACWEYEGEPFVGRFYADRWGPRLYAVCCRAPARAYQECAADFWVSCASLRPLLDWPTPWAEELTAVEQDAPFDWRASVPASWELRRHPAAEDGAWFDALHIAPAAPDEQLGEHDGRLTLAVMARGRARRPRDAADIYLAALRAAEMRIEDAEFDEEEVSKPFLQGWYATAAVEKNGALGELRCRVWMHQHAWIVAGVFGAPRDVDRAAWMRNKRALDVATATLELDTRL